MSNSMVHTLQILTGADWVRRDVTTCFTHDALRSALHPGLPRGLSEALVSRFQEHRVHLVNDDQIQVVKKKRKLESDKKSERKIEKDEQNKSQKVTPKSGPKSSCLFTKNPEIQPTIKNNVPKIKEKMFTKQAFSELTELHPFLIDNLEKVFGIVNMTVVQQKTIPAFLLEKDLLVKSQTGSGKTLAYAIPLVQRLQSLEPKIQRSDGILAIIILPTRELAIQTFECFQKLLRPFTRIVCGCFIGGQRRKSEKMSLRKGLNVVISTPCRLIDHMNSTNNLQLDGVSWLILDEADRLMDMGYEENMKTIIRTLDENQRRDLTRQTVMLSATLTTGVEQLAGITMNAPVVLDMAMETSATEEQSQFVVPKNLKQYYVITPIKLRLATLSAFLMSNCSELQSKVLVFMPTQDMVDYHTALFKAVLSKLDSLNVAISNDSESEEEEKTLKICSLHGNMTQPERTEVFKKFRAAASGILLCTDVASRGLDVPKVDWIVQYSAPASTAEYVHRVGRTARIGAKGSAILFIMPSETEFVNALQQQNISLECTEMADILQSVAGQATDVKSRKKMRKFATTQATEEAVTALQQRFEEHVANDKGLHDSGQKAFLSFVRFYSSYPVSVRHLFPFKEVHLGHVVKSLALCETPSSLGAKGNRPLKKGVTSRQRAPRPRGNMAAKPDLLSEFHSGV